MTNYEAVAQWTATLKADKAYNELLNLKDKYTWLKCDESLAFLKRMAEELPKYAHIVKLQEKQNAIHRMYTDRMQEYIRVNQVADEAIVNAVKTKYDL